MQPINSGLRRKKLITFIGLYLAGLATMLVIFLPYAMHPAQSEKPVHQLIDNKLQTRSALYITDSLLHEKLVALDYADKLVTALSKDSATSRTWSAIVQDADGKAAALQAAIDSIETISAENSGQQEQPLQPSLASFKTFLSYRLVNHASTNAKGYSNPTSFEEVGAMKSELAKRDEKIAKLESTLSLQPTVTGAMMQSSTDESKDHDLETTKNALTEQQQLFNELKDKYDHLKTEHNGLAQQLVEMRRNSTSQADREGSANSKVNALEQKVNDLNTDLYFSKIDCNMVRADAAQIISNARQRKQLLTESLSMLNSLASSRDADVQKRAKAKIVHLNQIATTLHD